MTRMTDIHPTFFLSLLEESIQHNVHTLVPIFLRGDVAVLLHEPDRCWEKTLSFLDWDERAKVFPLDRNRGMRTIGAIDCVAAEWLARRVDGCTGGRIFVIGHTASLLVNYSHDRGLPLNRPA